MLTIVLERFENFFITDEGRHAIDDCLFDEFNLLTDSAHLEKNVIGQPDFAWDYTALDEGFLQLVTPFMQRQSGIPHLFLHVLHELDAYRPEYLKAAVILEYTHYASLINDYYNFHDEFIQHDQNARKSQKLTQLRYAAQYLNNYPRYLLLQNSFNVDTQTIFSLHRWIINTFTVLGISRGLFIKWSHACFSSVQLEHYLQNAINSLCVEIIYPVIMACIFAKIPQDTLVQLKKAFGYLSLALKLRCETKAYLGAYGGSIDTYHESALLPLTFQGVGFIQNNLSIDAGGFSHTRFPDIRGLHHQVCLAVAEAGGSRFMDELKTMENTYIELFLAELGRAQILSVTAALFKKCFAL